MKYLVGLIAIIVFVGCEEKESLGNGYYYLPAGATYDYPYGSILYYSPTDNLYGKNILIYNSIMEVKKNKRYLIIRQHPHRETMQRRITDIINGNNDNRNDNQVWFPHGEESISDLFLNVENNENIVENIVDSMLNNIPYYQKIFTNLTNYWIIDKEEQNIIGPLNKNEFILKRKELDISILFNFE